VVGQVVDFQSVNGQSAPLLYFRSLYGSFMQ
jgi:hypothetical protein